MKTRSFVFHLTLRNVSPVTEKEETIIQIGKFKNDLKERDWGFEVAYKTLGKFPSPRSFR